MTTFSCWTNIFTAYAIAEISATACGSAIGSRDTLSVANYEAARLAMQTFRRDGGDPLGIVPTHLIVDPTNESAARAILSRELINGGESNPNYKTARLVVAHTL